jgi:hypothetical protein
MLLVLGYWTAATASLVGSGHTFRGKVDLIEDKSVAARVSHGWELNVMML